MGGRENMIQDEDTACEEQRGMSHAFDEQVTLNIRLEMKREMSVEKNGEEFDQEVFEDDPDVNGVADRLMQLTLIDSVTPDNCDMCEYKYQRTPASKGEEITCKKAKRIFNYIYSNSESGISIMNIKDNKYIRNKNGTACMTDNSVLNSVKMTVRHYLASSPDVWEGTSYKRPVVLNFTGSDMYLKCCWMEKTPVLTIEKQTKTALEDIKNNDKDILPFVFYKITKPCMSVYFESALCKGWFMKVKTEKVEMGPLSPETNSTTFEIQK